VDHFQETAVEVLEIHPAPIVVAVDFAGTALAGISPVREPSLTNAAENFRRSRFR
jgi:hypothetical protein